MVMGGGPDPAGDVLTALTNTFLELSRAGLAGDVLTHPPPIGICTQEDMGAMGSHAGTLKKAPQFFPRRRFAPPELQRGLPIK